MPRIACLIATSVVLILTSCRISTIVFPIRTSHLSGAVFYQEAASLHWQQRDSLALAAFHSGNVPDFWKKFVPISCSVFDSTTDKTIKATYYVSPDYFLIGTDEDWARIPLTPMAAQAIADTLGCFLPTRKMVDDIYQAAQIKLSPMPLFAYRDSSVTMYHHHLIVEGQRKSKKGLIAGIKKDVVITATLHGKTDRVAIYGWHRLDGKPIQPLYTGHVNWYVDYSHGIRLVYRKVKVEGRWMDYTEILQDPILKALLCNEEDCSYFRYP